jgi:hypothetical protein
MAGEKVDCPPEIMMLLTVSYVSKFKEGVRKI